MGACGAEEDEKNKKDLAANGEGAAAEGEAAAAEGENAVAAPLAGPAVSPQGPLEDGTVTFAPYFKLKDAAKFKELWKAATTITTCSEELRVMFWIKQEDAFIDCIHYAFTFTDDGRAHCREAYKSGEAVIQHIADVGGVFNGEVDAEAKKELKDLAGCIHPDVAELERLELHGPAAELEKIKKWNEGPKLPFQYFVTEWGFRPARPYMDDDTVVHLYPYFELKNEENFTKIWKDAYPATKAAAEEEKSHQYAFSFCKEGDSKGMASCREAYADAASMLLHIEHVGAQFHDKDAETGCIHPDNAKLARLEVHGPAAQLEIIKTTEGIKDLPWTYFETGTHPLGGSVWGFRLGGAHPKWRY